MARAITCKEYRISLPLSLDEYPIGQLYTIARASDEEKEKDTCSLRVIANRPAVHEKIGECQYSVKEMDISPRIPLVFRMMVKGIGSDVFKIVETSYNAYPRCVTRYVSKGLSEDTFHQNVETFHLHESGVRPNVFDIPSDRRSNVEIIDIDIAEEIASKKYDPSKVFPLVKGGGKRPISKGWRERFIESGVPFLTCYKLVTFNLDFIGGGMFIDYVFKKYTDLMRATHQRIYSTYNEWMGMDMNDIRKLEGEVYGCDVRESNAGAARA